jgi:ribosomal protein L11 methyltransferase
VRQVAFLRPAPVRGPGVRRHPAQLEIVSVDVPDDALEAYEAAFGATCSTVGFFRDNKTGDWRIEGVKPVGSKDAELAASLALAGALTGVASALRRRSIQAEGWLARTRAAFPEQQIGRRFAIRGTHLLGIPPPGRIMLRLDASLAFGSGEHGSTRGCLLALERVARLRPRRILDLGTGSGILAMAAAKLLHQPVIGIDIEPWSVRVATGNARLNELRGRARFRLADGWRHRKVRAAAPYDLVFGNILARPLCLMARGLSAHLALGGTAILSGILRPQARGVLAAHRRCGLRLQSTVQDGAWTTLILRRAAQKPM